MTHNKYQFKSCATVYETDKYNLFVFVKENRSVNLNRPNASKLKASLKKHGWAPSLPMKVAPNNEGKLEVHDGQHRLVIAKELQISVKFVIDNTPMDITDINNTPSQWTKTDYMNRWIKEGLEPYLEVQELFDTHEHVSLGMSIALLSNTTSWTNVRNAFQQGHYTVKTKGMAWRLCNYFEKCIDVNPDLAKTNFLKSIYAFFHVDEFDPKRFLDQISKNPQLVENYSKIDDLYDMGELIYNYRKHNNIPLAFLAKEKMSNKNAVKKNY